MAAQHLERAFAFGVTNIKSHIPLILDLADHNYDAWRELFLTHSITFDVVGHLDGTTFRLETMMLNGTRETAWSSFGFTGLCLLISSKAHLRPAVPLRTLWIRIENKVKNNKEAPAIQLDNELRTTEIGDLTIEAYYQKLKFLSDHQANVNAPLLIARLSPTFSMNSMKDSTTSSVSFSTVNHSPALQHKSQCCRWRRLDSKEQTNMLLSISTMFLPQQHSQ